MEELCCNGDLVKGNEGTRRKAKQYFQQLYSEDEFRRPSLDNLQLRVLSAESRDGLEAPFT